MKKALAMILALCMVFALCTTAACADDKKKIGVEMYTLRTEFYTTMDDVIHAKCDELGWDCVTLSAETDLTKEQENIEALISQGVDMIFMDPYQYDGSGEAIKLAVDAGIPIICMDSASNPEFGAITNVYADNMQNGILVGEYTVETLFPDNAPIHAIVFHGIQGLEACDSRAYGVVAGIIKGRTGCTEEEAIEKAKALDSEVNNKGKAFCEEANFYYDGIGYDLGQTSEGLRFGEDFLSSNPELNLFICNNDDVGYGGLEAVENMGAEDRIILVGAADGRKGTLEQMINNPDYLYKAIGNNMPSLVAETAFDIGYQILVEGADPASFGEVVNTPAVCMTAANAAEYYNPDAAF